MKDNHSWDNSKLQGIFLDNLVQEIKGIDIPINILRDELV